jgi:hypothetical protein
MACVPGIGIVSPKSRRIVRPQSSKTRYRPTDFERAGPRGFAPALPLLFLLVLLGLALSWEAAGVAVAGGSFDAGQAVAGIAFALIPALLLAPVAVRAGSRSAETQRHVPGNGQARIVEADATERAH